MFNLEGFFVHKSLEVFPRGHRMARRVLSQIVVACAAFLLVPSVLSQSMPGTAGETLSGKRIVLADATREHVAVLVAGFSREGGSGCGDWFKAIRADSALSGLAVYEIASLEGAPGIFRGAIESVMRKGMSAADQDLNVVLTQDDKLWRQYFGVDSDKEPYVVLIDANGKVLWKGHGAVADLERTLKAALR
jgi:hypothetical protein